MNKVDELKESLRLIALPIFEQTGMDLIELNLRRHAGEWMIQVLADRPQGGISLEECSLLNRQICEAIDKNQVMTEYSLEVSSPGIDRPLKSKKDFQRGINTTVRFHLSASFQGKKEYIGEIIDVNDLDVVIQSQKHGQIRIQISNIVKAVQVF